MTRVTVHLFSWLWEKECLVERNVVFVQLSVDEPCLYDYSRLDKIVFIRIKRTPVSVNLRRSDRPSSKMTCTYNMKLAKWICYKHGNTKTIIAKMKHVQSYFLLELLFITTKQQLYNFLHRKPYYGDGFN